MSTSWKLNFYLSLGLLARQRRNELQRVNEQLIQINAALRKQAKIESYAPSLSYAPIGGGRIPDNEIIVDPKKQELISKLKNGKNFLRNQQLDKAFIEFKNALELAQNLKDPIEEKKAARGLGLLSFLSCLWVRGLPTLSLCLLCACVRWMKDFTWCSMNTIEILHYRSFIAKTRKISRCYKIPFHGFGHLWTRRGGLREYRGIWGNCWLLHWAWRAWESRPFLWQVYCKTRKGLRWHVSCGFSFFFLIHPIWSDWFFWSKMRKWTFWDFGEKDIACFQEWNISP